MSRNRYLNIKGAILDKRQLEEYLEKVASDHILIRSSKRDTYPIPRVKENYQYILEVYQLLNEHLKMGISIHPAGEWILDNFYIIEENVKEVIHELPKDKYCNLTGLYTGKYAGFARVYVLASEIVAYTDNKLDSNVIKDCINAYQNKKSLNMDEMWNIGVFFKIALIENIRQICEKIYSAQLQKEKAEDLINRFVKENTHNVTEFNLVHRLKPNSADKFAFLEYISGRLREYGKSAYPFFKVVEDTVRKMGTTLSEVVKKEHFDIAIRRLSMANAILSIKNIMRIDFMEIFEQVNGVDEILNNDPTGTYENMDYKTKSYYRNAINKISKKTKVSEVYVAKKALELAVNNNDDIERKKHVGYYLVDAGKDSLLFELTGKRTYHMNERTKVMLYIDFIYMISIIFSVVIGTKFYMQIHSGLFNWLGGINTVYAYAISTLLGLVCGFIVVFMVFIMLKEVLTQITQYVLSKVVKPRLIPKMDFRDGIPSTAKTVVVVPTILDSEEKVRELAKDLEVYYLANKSENMYFAILGDCKASDNKYEALDDAIIDTGLSEINELNKKYHEDGDTNKFQFIYRERVWNEGEKKYIGWERKRGLLNQFNEYILGHTKNIFKINTFESSLQDGKLPKIKYIITLDADTKLALNSGIELVSAMEHILNKPVLNYTKDVVVKRSWVSSAKSWN